MIRVSSGSSRWLASGRGGWPTHKPLPGTAYLVGGITTLSLLALNRIVRCYMLDSNKGCFALNCSPVYAPCNISVWNDSYESRLLSINRIATHRAHNTYTYRCCFELELQPLYPVL